MLEIHFGDDGTFPNSALPVRVYRQVFEPEAAGIEKTLATHGWTNSWRNGVYPYHHYHSTAHEVLAVYRGQARPCLGGPKLGQELEVSAGDLLVIPAGVAHQRIEASPDFAVVGAYAEGRDWDLLRGDPSDRPQADDNLAALPPPRTDPVTSAPYPP